MSDLVDALPYIDHEYNDSQVKLAVAQMVEDETRRYKPTKNYLETLPNLPLLNLSEFETDILKKEFERLQSGQRMEPFDDKRYKIDQSLPVNKQSDIGAWLDLLNNSYAQLENKAIELQNLELMTIFGAESWKAYNQFLTKMLERSKMQVDQLRKEIQEINLNRKTSQFKAGEKIEKLESDWVSLVSKNYEIERACVQLENEISTLKSQLEKERSGN